jgi:hypothetical protein
MEGGPLLKQTGTMKRQDWQPPQVAHATVTEAS